MSFYDPIPGFYRTETRRFRPRLEALARQHQDRMGKFDASSLEPSLAIAMHVSCQNGHDSNTLDLALSDSISDSHFQLTFSIHSPGIPMPPEVMTHGVALSFNPVLLDVRVDLPPPDILHSGTHGWSHCSSDLVKRVMNGVSIG